MKKEEEAAQLAAEEKAKFDSENARKKQIEESIKALGYVYFDLNSSFLNANDKALLDRLAIILEENPSVVIKVTSHTDSRGSNNYNQWLSERRVKRTTDYLISKGVDAKRIQGVGFGEDKLTNECDDKIYCTEEKHRENRRSEFSVFSY